MKVEIVIDPACEETTATIVACRYSQELEELKVSLLAQASTDKVVAFDDGGVRLLSLREILRFYTKNGKIFCDTLNATYAIRMKLYEVESRTHVCQFIKISRSEIVNLDYVVRLDLSFAGTIALVMSDKKISYVSRRYLKNFKQVLGL